MSKPVELGSLRVGSCIVIDGEPCRIVEYEKSKPGKHGATKVRVVGIGLFDDVKRSLLAPSSATVDVPLLEKRDGQIISMSVKTVQVMDLETFEVLELPMPTEEVGVMEQGARVEYWRAMGRSKIMRIKGEVT